MNVLLVDDHTVVLDGLELLLSTFEFVKKTDKATNEEMLLVKLHQDPLPDIILMDIELGLSDGLTLCKELKKKHPHIKVIALTSHSDTYTVKSSVRAGVDGYLLKSDDRLTVMEALKMVMSGSQFYSPYLKEVFFQQSISTKKTLTKREEDVLRLIVQEKTTKEIAEDLCISEKTVENHRSNMMLKLEAKNMAGLVKNAISRGLV